jgi:Phage integrase family/Phage integrase, N-terminal SAM-like domain
MPDPLRVSGALQTEIDNLLAASLSDNTKKSYNYYIDNFTEFANSLGLKHHFPPKTNVIAEFIAFLSLNQYSYSTVSGHIAALSYVNKINGLPDNTKHFMIRAMLEGLRKKRKNWDCRQPITGAILGKLICVLKNVCRSKYEVMLFAACFSLAFLALLRISEFALPNKNSKKYVLRYQDIVMGNNMIRLYFVSSKTDQRGYGTHLDVKIDSQNIQYYDHIATYLAYRNKSSVPLFCHFDGSPLTTFQFNYVLKRALKFAGLENTRLKSHSFRIGGATSLFKSGVPISEIKYRGRWQSNAYRSYIR